MRSLFISAMLLASSVVLAGSWIPAAAFIQGDMGEQKITDHRAKALHAGAIWFLRNHVSEDDILFPLVELGMYRVKGQKVFKEGRTRVFAIFGGNFIFRWTSPRRWKLKEKFGFSPFLQVGTGPFYFTKKSVTYTQRPLSTNLQFGSQAGGGLRFGQNDSCELGLIYRHFSNANIRYPNYSLDFIELKFAYWF